MIGTVFGGRPLTRPERSKARRELFAAAAALLMVTALSCERTPRDPGAGDQPQLPPSIDSTAQPTELSGFRADAWFLPEGELLGFVEVAAGEFVMGSDPAIDALAFANERWGDGAQGTVDLPAFYIGRYEVTVAQFGAFVHATKYSVDARALQAPPDHPVTWVSWPDALAYCRWLEVTLRESPQIPPQLSQALGAGWSIELPNEAQWEKAARGADGRIYPWGNTPAAARANYRGNATTPVGAFSCPECAFGLFDMSGNVWELTRSPYQPYPYDPSDDLDDLETDALWVMRGGHFGDPEQNIRAAVRGGVDPGARRPFIGFRLAIVPTVSSRYP